MLLNVQVSERKYQRNYPLPFWSCCVNPKQNRAYYKCAPISHVSTLTRVLEITESELRHLVGRANSLYVPGPKFKKADGKYRYTYKALPDLCIVQKRLMKRVLRNVAFPEYLQGAIYDPVNPRSYIRNAGFHCDAQYVIKADISNFFPSITADHVATIWTNFFRFSDDVARYLTALVTKDGFVAQGLSTSTYIANLVFWDIEPNVFSRLKSRHLTYSRYIDDVTVSTHESIRTRTKTYAVSQIIGMFSCKGFRAKRSKLHILNSSNRMTVHNLAVNRGVSLTKQKRSQLRSAVRQIELRYPDEMDTDQYYKDWNTVASRVGHAKQFHPAFANTLRSRLEQVRPNR